MANLEKALRKENNLQDKKLSGENNIILTDMVVYLRSSNLCEYDIEVIRKELIGMALEAQLRNEDFKNVIGSDYKFFCDELIQSGRQKTFYDKILEFLYVVVFGVGALFLYEILSHAANILKHDGLSLNLMYLPISVGFLMSTVCAVVFAYGIFIFFSKYAFELTKSKIYKYSFVIGFAVIFCGMVACRYFLDQYVLIAINTVIPIALWMVGFIAVKLLSDKHANDLAKTHQ